MVRYLTGFFLSFLVSNWCYSEFSLIIPGFDSFCRKAYEQVKLPTHDAWPGIFSNSVPSKIKDQVYAVLDQLPTDSALYKVSNTLGISDPDVRALHDQAANIAETSGSFIKLFDSGRIDFSLKSFSTTNIFSKL